MTENEHKPTIPTRRKTPRWIKKFGRSLSKSNAAAVVFSWIGVGYLELVYWTNRFIVEPENAIDLVKPEQPVILAVWHGQHILLPALRINLPASVMISRSLDGEITARIAKAYGSKAIRASGGREQKKNLEKGGMRGFLEMLNALEIGENVVQTADVPKGTPRRAGEGIIRLAAKSGCSIVPLAVASSRHHKFSKAWDNAAFNLPFGRTSICMGKILQVPKEKSQHETARHELETELKRITTRAYHLVGVNDE